MSKPSTKNCAVVVQHNDHNVRAARYGHAPLIHLWIHKDNSGGTGIVLDVDQAVELIEGMHDLLDDIEGVTT